MKRALDAFDRLEGQYSLREAVDFFLTNYKKPTSDFKISDVLENFYDAKLLATPKRSFAATTSKWSRKTRSSNFGG